MGERQPGQQHPSEAAEPAAPEQITTPAAARAAVQDCRRCPLYATATQAVFGEGPEHAAMLFVGEQPGDREDLAGRPFVGPAGAVFERALAEAGIDRTGIYVTNAVKHFKFVPRGKKRLHQRPDTAEIAACRFWLDLERRFVGPRVVVALGATAAHSLLGRAVAVGRSRGQPIRLEDGSILFVTTHPSYLLRIPDRQAAAAARERFIADLRQAHEAAAQTGDAA